MTDSKRSFSWLTKRQRVQAGLTPITIRLGPWLSALGAPGRSLSDILRTDGVSAPYVVRQTPQKVEMLGAKDPWLIAATNQRHAG